MESYYGGKNILLRSSKLLLWNRNQKGLVLLAVTAICYQFAFNDLFLLPTYNPYEWVLWVSYVLQIILVISFSIVLVSDPGVILRSKMALPHKPKINLPDEDPSASVIMEMETKEPGSLNQLSSPTASLSAPEFATNELAYLTTRDCIPCQIRKPPKAVHCKKCDHCVAEYEVHSNFLGKCIARRNRRCVFVLLNAYSFLMLIGIVLVMVKLVRAALLAYQTQSLTIDLQLVLLIGSLIQQYTFLSPVITTWSFYWFRITQGRTTKEIRLVTLSSVYDKTIYSPGVLIRNMCNFFCTSNPKSNLT